MVIRPAGKACANQAGRFQPRDRPLQLSGSGTPADALRCLDCPFSPSLGLAQFRGLVAKLHCLRAIWDLCRRISAFGMPGHGSLMNSALTTNNSKAVGFHNGLAA